MDFRNCELCNKIFNYTGYGLVYCKDCLKRDEELMRAVKDYLDRNPGAEGDEVSEKTGASVETMTKWMKDGRLIHPAAINLGLKCQSCGARIYKGFLCDDCIAGYKQELMDAAESKEEKKKIERHIGGFRFLEDKKR